MFHCACVLAGFLTLQVSKNYHLTGALAMNLLIELPWLTDGGRAMKLPEISDTCFVSSLACLHNT